MVARPLTDRAISPGEVRLADADFSVLRRIGADSDSCYTGGERNCAQERFRMHRNGEQQYNKAFHVLGWAGPRRTVPINCLT